MILALLAALASQPSAQPAAPTPPAARPASDPAALAEAMRLLDTENFEQEALSASEMTLEATLGLMNEQIQAQTSEPAPEEFLEKLRQLMRDHTSAIMRANLPAMKRQAAEIYVQEFTREELIRLRQLAMDPVMVKARERTKVMAPKLMMIGIQVMRNAEPELKGKVERLVEDYLKSKGDSDADRS